MPSIPVPQVTLVEIRDRDLYNKKTGAVILRATNHSDWKTLQRDKAFRAVIGKGEVELYLATWQSREWEDMPDGTKVGEIIVHHSDETYVLDGSGKAIGYIYDLSLHQNRRKLVIPAVSDDVQF